MGENTPSSDDIHSKAFDRLKSELNWSKCRICGADYGGDHRSEVLVNSPWGIGMLKLSGSALNAPTMQPNGARFGGWLLNTIDNDLGHGVGSGSLLGLVA
jgi:hypothetical protein